TIAKTTKTSSLFPICARLFIPTRAPLADSNAWLRRLTHRLREATKENGAAAHYGGEENRMKHHNTLQDHVARRIRLIACIGVLGTAFTIALPQAAHAQDITPPSVPDRLNVPQGNEAFLIGHAFGSQDYVCAASGSGVAFVLTT